MQKLIQGLHRFQETIFAPQRELFERLAERQTPDTLFITCSDSRINPNLITQTGPGDLFILRNAGNVVPPHGASNGGEAATIEFAVGALRVRDVVICGHSHCGAMKALLHPEDSTDLPALRQWLSHCEGTRRLIQENYTHLADNALLTAAVEENVLMQIDNLRTHPTVHSRLSRGDLHLHAWVYKIETGEVFYYDHQRGQFLLLSEAARAEPSGIDRPAI